MEPRPRSTGWPRTAFLAFTLLSLGWLGHVTYEKHIYWEEAQKIIPVRENSSKYHFINPLLYIDNANVEFHELDSLKENFEELAEKMLKEKQADRLSVYFRDLNSSQWTGYKADEKYVPGSMLKISTLLIYLQLAEEDPSVLNKSLYYDNQENNDQYYIPDEELKSGYYKVTTLLGHSIIESDNAAHLTLSFPIENELSAFYKTLQLPLIPKKINDFLSPREMSRIYRALYSATYLSETYSEQALELLTRTTFNKGLTSGIKAGVPIAHKFGEHRVFYLTPERSPDFQLHDCGIIYFPNRPYLLCVMTEGKSFENLEKIISEFSRTAYDFVNEKWK